MTPEKAMRGLAADELGNEILACSHRCGLCVSCREDVEELVRRASERDAAVAQAEEAERRSAIDQRQCDEMTARCAQAVANFEALAEGFAEKEAEAARLRGALRENVGDAYNLLTQGESPTQRRGPSARRIYDRSRAALAGGDSE